jgi:hypothetical protein
MSDSNDNDNDSEPRSHILNGGSRSSSLNNQGGVVTHPARHLCLTETDYRCEHLVLLPATNEGLVGAEMSTPALLTDNTLVRLTILSPGNPGGGGGGGKTTPPTKNKPSS